MPNRDGTGPNRNRSNKRNPRNYFNNNKGKFSIVGAIIMPTIGYIINDLKKDKNLIKKILNKIRFNRNTDKNLNEEIQNAKYEVLNENGEN